MTSKNQINQQIETIWQQLENKDLMGRTLVILTADLANAEKMKNSFSAERLEVPLMFYWQGEGQLYNQLSSHLDISLVCLILRMITPKVLIYLNQTTAFGC